MRDGRIVHRLARRADLIILIQRKPTDLEEQRPVTALTRWHINDGFIPSRLMYLAPSAISQVIQVPPEAQ
jgi:hypothetical protein